MYALSPWRKNASASAGPATPVCATAELHPEGRHGRYPLRLPAGRRRRTGDARLFLRRQRPDEGLYRPYYPIWQHLGRKEVYYIVSAGLGEDIIARSLGDLDGFVEHFEQYEIKGRLYAPNVMEAGAVRTLPVMEAAYQAGLHV